MLVCPTDVVLKTTLTLIYAIFHLISVITIVFSNFTFNYYILKSLQLSNLPTKHRFTFLLNKNCLLSRYYKNNFMGVTRDGNRTHIDFN